MCPDLPQSGMGVIGIVHIKNKDHIPDADGRGIAPRLCGGGLREFDQTNFAPSARAVRHDHKTHGPSGHIQREKSACGALRICLIELDLKAKSAVKD